MCKKIFALFTALNICFSLMVNAQRTKDGNYNSSNDFIANEYTKVLADVVAGQKVLSVQNSALNTNGRFASNLQPGDLIFIYQAQGATIKSSANDSTWGEVTNYNNAGLYEFVEVDEVPNANTINLACGTKNNYTSAGKVQVVRVPRYDNLTINTGDTLKGDAWDGDIGGLIIVEVANNFTIDGVVSATALGFRGGACVATSSTWDLPIYYSNDPLQGGQKGEGIAGYQSDYTSYGGMYGRGAAANGGGGGNSDDAGGGGGGNARNNNAYSGYGIPDTSNNNYKTAWNLEWAGLAGHVSSGGGRGGYTNSGDNANPLTNGPGTAAWSNLRHSYGGKGGRGLDYSTGRLFFGGGGGAGENNNLVSSAGGRGGGLILIRASNVSPLSNSLIVSNGVDGQSLQNPHAFDPTTDGAGGGGAGGTIIIEAENIVTGLDFEAVGGRGGSITNTAIFISSDYSKGPGGGGGGGYVRTPIASTINILGGKAGTTSVTTFNSFPMNGATDGGSGDLLVQAFAPTKILISDTAVCSGNSVTLTATVVNGNAADLVWYDAYNQGNVLATGASFVTPNLNSPQTYYVGLCGLEYKDTVTVSITSGVTADAGKDTATCASAPIQLQASGGNAYKWWPNTNISNVSIANPIVTPTVQTKYYVEVSAGGCKDTDSVVVSINSKLTVDLGKDQLICEGDSVKLVSGIGSSWAWWPNTYISSITDSVVWVYPKDTLKYYVDVTDKNGCTGSDTVIINVVPKIVINTISNSEVCKDSCLNVNVTTTGGGAGPFTYSWTDAGLGANRVICINKDTALTVTVSEPTTGCSDTESFSVQVHQPKANFTFDAACLNEPSKFTQTATTNLGTITKYEWILGDGNKETQASFNHTYTTTGTKNVFFIVFDNIGCSDTINKNIDISPVPTSKIGNADTTICLGAPVNFADSSANGQNISKVKWDFANNDSSAVNNLKYTYQVAGVYNVNLIVTNNSGCSDTDTVVVTVNNKPTADFSIPDSVPFGTLVKVDNKSKNAISFEWLYLGNVVGKQKEFSQAFSVVGSNCLNLYVKDFNNCADTVTKCVIVGPESLVISNVFTPNNDGYNDYFVLKGSDGRSINIDVYDRWGKLIYSETDYKNDWDGKDKNGKLVVPGNYFYVVSDVGSKENWNGFVYITY